LFGTRTDLTIHDSISNLINKIRHDLDILSISHIIRSFNMAQYHLKFVLDPIEGSRKESVQGQVRRSQSDQL